MCPVCLGERVCVSMSAFIHVLNIFKGAYILNAFMPKKQNINVDIAHALYITPILFPKYFYLLLINEFMEKPFERKLK